MAKYIIVVGGVISGTGKGISAASIGLLLKLRGHDITLIKFDPYLNVNCGIIRPADHGEVFVCNDGSEVDLDLGSYERLVGIETSVKNICTSGTLHKELIEEQELGKYLGSTIQLIPHMTDKIQQRLLELGENKDVVIAEIGGTVGDSESFSFFEGIRQFKQKLKENVLIVMVAPILWVNTIKEFKTKPLQNSVKELQRHGLQPDLMFCRTDRQVPEKILDKISMMTNVKREFIIEAGDVKSIYQVPLEFYNHHVDDLFVDMLRLPRSACRISKYRELVEKLTLNDLSIVKIGIVHKYDNVEESYVSLKEALVHAGVANNLKVEIVWIKADDLEEKKDISNFMKDVSGIIIPGGFGIRGIEGKIKAAKYARENNVPYLGICLGLQIAVIEFARNVCGFENANSTEFNSKTEHPVINFIEGQENLQKKSGTLRLGAYDCELSKDSMVYKLYSKKTISERHRHRYEVNSEYVDVLEENGLRVVGMNPENDLVEIMELSNHNYYIGTQYHGEYKSRLNLPNPLFVGLIEAAKKYSELHVKT